MSTILISSIIGFVALVLAGPFLIPQMTPDGGETAKLKAELESLRAKVKTLRTEIVKLRDQVRRTSENKERDYGDIDKQVQMLNTPTGVEFALLGNKPDSPTATVFWFGGAIRLSGAEIVPFLIKHGYLCVSLDAPCHGQNLEPAEPCSGIEGWRYRIEHKRNFVHEFNEKASKVLDYLIAEGYTDPGRLAVLGGSRGAFLAFHYAASEPRVKCVGGHIPVIDLRALKEFKGMENDPLIKSLSVINLAEKFAGHKVLVIIGDRDDRVGTDHAIAFARRVSKVAKNANVELHVLPGGHYHMAGLGELTELWLKKDLSPHEHSK